MIALLQRVARAAVRVDGEEIASIEKGILALVAVERGDTDDAARRLAERVLAYRIFADAAGKVNLSLTDVKGELLAVSQFTLAGSLARGRRPGFDNAEEPERARTMFELFVRELASTGIEVQTGRFREYMIVSLENYGPVTFIWP